MKWVEEKGYRLGDVMNAFRLALVGIGKGPGMFDISAFLARRRPSVASIAPSANWDKNGQARPPFCLSRH